MNQVKISEKTERTEAPLVIYLPESSIYEEDNSKYNAGNKDDSYEENVVRRIINKLLLPFRLI